MNRCLKTGADGALDHPCVFAAHVKHINTQQNILWTDWRPLVWSFVIENVIVCFLFANIRLHCGIGRGTGSLLSRWRRRTNDIMYSSWILNYTTHETSRWKPWDILLKKLLIHFAKSWSDAFLSDLLRAATKDKRGLENKSEEGGEEKQVSASWLLQQRLTVAAAVRPEPDSSFSLKQEQWTRGPKSSSRQGRMETVPTWRRSCSSWGLLSELRAATWRTGRPPGPRLPATGLSSRSRCCGWWTRPSGPGA